MTASPKLPKYVNARAICDALNEGLKEPEWTHDRVKNILRRMGVAKKVGGAVCVTPEDLAGQWPEMYESIIERLGTLPKVEHGNVRINRIKRANKQKSGKGGHATCEPGCDNYSPKR